MKKIEDARRLYERLVAQFPSAGKYWKIYIEHEVCIQTYEYLTKTIVIVVHEQCCIWEHLDIVGIFRHI